MRAKTIISPANKAARRHATSRASKKASATRHTKIFATFPPTLRARKTTNHPAKLLLLFCLLLALLAPASHAQICQNRAFDLQSKPNLSPRILLEELASICGLSLSYESHAQEALERTKMVFNFRQKRANDILQAIAKASDTHYILDGAILRFSHLQTKTFHINYIATARVGSSNTDVVYGQESQSQYLNPHTSYQNSAYLNTHSALGEDIQQKALTQGTQNPVFGKSGTKIYSIDELNLWGDLENELIAIVYQESDSYNPKHPRIIINKGAGLITLSATPRQLLRVGDYIDALQARLSQQVQIDVQIFSIEHSDINTTGINWAKLYELGINTQSTPEALASITPSGLNYGVYVFSQNLSVGQIVQFLKEYGKTHSISNPKIITLNNQPAIISVGNVLRYSQSLIYQTSTNSSTIQNTGYQYPSVFSGVLLDVTPSIYDKEIILKINPSITAAKDASIENQASALSAPPNLSTNQLSSIVRIKDGQRVILGGLISESNITSRRGLPLLGAIPVIKYLFSYKKTIKQKKEMIIVITPTIIDNQSIEYVFDENQSG